MADEPETRPSLDDASKIDPAALQRWFEIPTDASLELHATRTDFDALFLGLRNMMFAQGSAMAAFQSYTHGNTELATHQFEGAVKHHADALELITRFTSGIMAKAQKL